MSTQRFVTPEELRKRLATVFDRLMTLKQPDESLSAFAKRVGLSLSSLRRWKTGVIPKPWTHLKVAAKLGVSVAWLGLAWGTDRETFLEPQR